MSIESCLTAFENLSRKLNTKKTTFVAATEDKNLAKATVETWFRDERHAIVDLIGEPAAVTQIDKEMQGILRLTLRSSKRTAYKQSLKQAIRLLKTSLLTEVKIAEWGQVKIPNPSVGNPEVKSRLSKLSPLLATCYEQVLRDLTSDRLSYRGTANELREVLRESLDLLAPDHEVKACQWFRSTRKSAKTKTEKNRGPTRAEKIRYALEKRNLGAEIGTAQKTADLIDSKFGNLVGQSLYGRASAATHVQKDRKEIIQILRYTDAVLLEMLPSS